MVYLTIFNALPECSPLLDFLSYHLLLLQVDKMSVNIINNKKLSTYSYICYVKIVMYLMMLHNTISYWGIYN